MAWDDILKEDGDHLLQETGDQILIEPKVFTYSAVTQDLELSGSGSYSAQIPTTYTYTVITQDLKLSGTASTSLDAVGREWIVPGYGQINEFGQRSAIIPGYGQVLEAQGEAAAVGEHTYNGTGGFLVAGAATYTKHKVATVVTTDVKCQGSATKALIKEFLAAAAGLILAGSATTATAKAYTYTP